MWSDQKLMMGVFGAIFVLVFGLTHAQNSPQDYIELHNRARAEVGVGPMTWNRTLEAYAQAYAEERRNDCAVDRSNGPYGENIGVGYYRDFSGEDAVKLWVDTKPLYDYASNSCVGGQCGYYTQVVWRNSVNLGCGRVPCLGSSQIVVCSYSPPGNIQGQKPY